MKKKEMVPRSTWLGIKQNEALKKLVLRWNKKNNSERPLNDFIREGVDLVLQKYK